MQTSKMFPVAADDLRGLQGSPFRVGDFLTYVRARRVESHQYAIARVGGVVGVHRGKPDGAQILGRVTGYWSQC
ncbi:hypothetical protein [Paraburkholderia diazotrophica]|uniref:Uncharacterized protein n=1 Tax=Paraburkholderia diazotrophica TaxID=667676 RepID=A0A1H6V638_9BURK|nr:hypothetical protein [Paraburkholderia diazotrophica]SEI96110.1 hypothetical protein SAMN05192539_1005204 [Paraburkholderia diazotrophica]